MLGITILSGLRILDVWFMRRKPVIIGVERTAPPILKQHIRLQVILNSSMKLRLVVIVRKLVLASFGGN